MSRKIYKCPKVVFIHIILTTGVYLLTIIKFIAWTGRILLKTGAFDIILLLLLSMLLTVSCFGHFFHVCACNLLKEHPQNEQPTSPQMFVVGCRPLFVTFYHHASIFRCSFIVCRYFLGFLKIKKIKEIFG